MNESILLDLPSELRTPRLLLRVPRFGDGPRVNAAIMESINELSRWMIWMHPLPQVHDTELWCRRAAVKFLAREQFHFSLYLHGADTCIGTCGIYRCDLKVPFVEIGYWLSTPHTGKGYATEALNAITSFAFDALRVVRVEVRCDVENIRSQRVAERAGFTLEGTLRNDARTPQGGLRSTRIFAKIAPGS